MYKIGDVVIVRDDLCVGEEYENDWGCRKSAMFATPMKKYMGRQFEIIDMTGEYYHIDIDDSDMWYWTDGMFAGSAEPAYFESDFDVFTCDIVSELMRCDDA